MFKITSDYDKNYGIKFNIKKTRGRDNHIP